MRLDGKIALMGAGSTLITAIALLALAMWQSSQYNLLAQREVELLIDADLNHITQGVYNLVHTENEAVQHQVDDNLKVARHLLTNAGGIRMSGETVNWTAVNQFTGQTETLHLPKLFVGGTWLGKNTDVAIETPIVDEVTRLVGETATIFQRMNERGDMLRVATNVRNTAGERAIGTYIPAINPDGADNPVISTILMGKTYHGRAYVVNAWYLTAYEPIYARSGRLVGMLYVGTSQKTAEDRIRHAILHTKVGRTGYVYILSGRGESRGRYVISFKGERDGEDIWLSKDSDDRYVIQEIINKAIVLQPGEMTTVRYRWQNPGEPAPRWKIARLAYFKPWDWVIGTSVYEDELSTYRILLDNGRRRMTRVMGIAGLAITVIVALAGIIIAWTITRPVRQMRNVADKVIAGDLTQVVKVATRDEIGVLARTFNLMTGKLRQSIEGLKQSEKKYRDIFDNALEGVFQTDEAGGIVNANPAMARILGYTSPEELITEVADIGRQIYAHPGERVTFIQKLQALGGEGAGIEIQLQRKDGTPIWVSISARLVKDANGQPAFIEGFVSDISVRKHAEDALAESKDFLDEIFNAVGDPMFVKDRRHRWVLLNNPMCAFLGRERTALLGKSDDDYFPSNEAEVFRSKDELVLTTGEVNINEETVTDAQGVVHTIVTKKTLYTDKQGEKFIVGIIRDITSLKRAEEEKQMLEARLTQSQKMEAIGTLAGGIAHDFNNILSAIIGFTELAREGIGSNDPAQKNLNEVLKAGNRAKELVKQILTFSRMTETEYSPIALRSVIKESLGMLRSIIPSTIKIVQNISASGLVMSDPTQINQILMNLCTNALHAMDEKGGDLEVALKEIVMDDATVAEKLGIEKGPYLTLIIRDTGKGIPPEIKDRIFEPYFTTKELGRGTGLGLSVIHGIVQSHKGAITCTSVPGKGTTFTVYLPKITTAQGKGAIQPELALPGGNERILFVDDEPILADMAAKILSSKGYSVVFKTSSLEALALFRDDPHGFDVVITDMTMPGMTGDRLAQALLEIRQDIPVILCTGYSEHMSEKKAKAIGIREFILKPLNMHTMTAAIRKVFDDAEKA